MDYISLEIADGIGKITLNRPQVFNSFNHAMRLELQQALAECDQPEHVRVVYLTGAGRAFCAGQDIAEITGDQNPGFKKILSIFFITKNKIMTAIAGVISSAINIDENATEYVVYVAVPGMQRGDFSITIGQGVLTITALRVRIHCIASEHSKKKKNLFSGRITIELPGDSDTVMTAAIYRNGELQIHIPKGEKEENNEPTEVFVY